MGIDKVSENRVVTGSDGGRSAANLNYILYIVGFFTGITALIGVILAYSNRETASENIRSHFDWQIKIFWRSFRFWIVISILYFVFTFIAVLTLGLGFILFLIPFAIWIWWLVSTIKRIAAGMRALGLGQPIAFYGGVTVSDVGSVTPAGAAAIAAPAPVAVMPPKDWYDDAQRPGHKRWWDGAAWGMKDDEYPSVASESPGADAEIAVAPAEIAATSAGIAVASAEPSAEIAVAPAATLPEPAPETAVVATAVEPSAEVAPAAVSSSAPEPASAPRFCENCGAERRPGGRFCTSCGQA